jgi:subtilase family serine protease
MSSNKIKVVLVVITALLMVTSMLSIDMSAGHSTVVNNTIPSGKSSPGIYYKTPDSSVKGFSNTGPVNANKVLNFNIYIPLRNESLLNSLAYQISNPNSPLLDHFMNYTEIEDKFMNKNQYNNDLKTLGGDGFKILNANDPVITASGTEQQISQYLGIQTNCYSNGSSSYYYGHGISKLPDSQISVTNISSLIYAHPSDLVSESQIKATSKLASSQNETAPLVGYSPKYLESVYNATGMYSKGYNGTGQTIGILDFGGDPFIKSQLSYYDHEFNISSPPNFTIAPIGPYQPICGISSGWDGEISLDVEASHTMAPGANITLYIANLDCDLAPVIAEIDHYDKVNDLSQSFSIADSDITSSSAYYACEQETNFLYELGSIEGISFSASSGDAGASGFSTGPLGSVGFPAVSPYVTSVGGTSTYLDFKGTAVSSFYQTAWSNYGFVPDDINYGGSTGGISYTQPLMPYQNSSIIPKGQPCGKTVPDVSFQASIYPGFLYVMPGNETEITGGTSEASPILAGLTVLADQEIGHKIGMLEPSIYYLGDHDYKNVFIPVTFGNNIPYTDNYGYNLVTGWGSLNIANFAKAYETFNLSDRLSVVVCANTSNFNQTRFGEFQPGETVNVNAIINSTMNMNFSNELSMSTNVKTGNFHASLITLEGNVTTIELSYNSTENRWTGNIIVPSDVSGPSYIEVYGNNDLKRGLGIDNVFIGDYLNIISPASTAPCSTNAPSGMEVEGYLSYLNGTIVQGTNATISIYAYSILNNTYYKVYTTKLIATNITTHTYAKNATILLGSVPESAHLPDTVSLIRGDSAYSFTPFMNGPLLQDSSILGPNVVEPGAVGAGQYIDVKGEVTPPSNIETSFDSNCSNITFGLYSPSHKEVSSATYNLVDSLYPSTIPELYVPANSTAGLYTILINTSYYSHTSGVYINGSFYGQIYVTHAISPLISIDSVAYEGQRLMVKANIAYPNGTEVKYGMYSATIYPTLLQKSYYMLTEDTQIPLNYNSTLNEWTGYLTLPSATSDGSYGINFEGLSVPVTYLPPGEYGVYISGISANAYPTTTALNAQKTFEINPEEMIANKHITTEVLTNNLAFEGDTILYNGSVSNSIFINANYIDNSVFSIYNARINGTLYVNNSTVYLNNSLGGNIVAKNSTIIMTSSYVNNINLESSKLKSFDSGYKTITPSQPLVNIVSPVVDKDYSGNITMNIQVTGSNIAYTQVFVNNKMVYNSTSTTLKFKFDTSSLPDGTYNVTVKTIQNDGISTYNYTELHTNNTEVQQSHNLKKLSASNAVVYDIAYASIGLGAIGTALGIFTVLIRRK